MERNIGLVMTEGQKNKKIGFSIGRKQLLAGFMIDHDKPLRYKILKRLEI